MKATKSLDRSLRGHMKRKHAEAAVILDADDEELEERLEASTLRLFDDPDLFDEDDTDEDAQQVVREMTGQVWH